ncbi:MAG TPA: protein phosphatase 2C domain-containing protein [Pirellulaceae bacterium]|nr:protein phosphatase 2C domain-containing protein [Pirellulaceae bacterium]
MSSAEHDTVEIPLPGVRSTARPQLPSIQVAVELGAKTHPGLVRPINEDSYLVARADRSLETLLTNLKPGEIPAWEAERSYGLVVADGMGGHAAGEVASHVALRAVVEHVLATADWVMRDVAMHHAVIEERLAQRFAAADEAVQDEASRNPRWAGMGTTMTLAVSSGANLFLGHIGDSRAYLLRGGNMQVLTRDHSYAQALADAGFISQSEVAAHRMRNVLLRSLGGGSVQADVRHLPLHSGDRLLLCTDGLTDMVAEPVIAEILQSAATAQAACDLLIASALAAGGRDNVTVVLARYAWQQV